ncbi:MAG: sulfatase-like hydrolase/transferase [Isosphaeraceae bacterium]
MMKVSVPLALVFLFTAGSAAMAAASDKPNIIFVLADDLGIDGVSCYGADSHRTPHIDKLAESGLRFNTCYASPLCGPSRCLLMTGRYAFRTGGITNESWRAGGSGARSADEFPMARLMKQAGYATGQAGKWRQLGESPRDWGFDEYLTDNTASGWYWETKYNKNGKELDLPRGTYGYDDNIRYMDKQLGAMVAELERLGLRQNTLVVFSGDNGTAAGYPSPVHGRMINGWKGSMLEGGSRVPLIASWPAVTPAGKVLDDIVSFADPYATFAELAGVKPPEGFKIDGQSFAARLRGEPGTPRAWAYVQLDGHWYVREPGFKLNEAGSLFDMSDAPFVEKLVPPEADTAQSKAARQRLAAVLAKLDPAGGKTDSAGGRRKPGRADSSGSTPAVGPWKSGDSLPGARAPDIAGKALEILAEIEPTGTEGVIVTQGGAARGYAVYLTAGKLAFAVRENGKLTEIVAKDPLGNGCFLVLATLRQDGDLALMVDGKKVAEGKAAGLIQPQPQAGLSVGSAAHAAVGNYIPPNPFKGKVSNVRVKTTTVR